MIGREPKNFLAARDITANESRARKPIKFDDVGARANENAYVLKGETGTPSPP